MGTSLQLVDRLVPGQNLESYIQAASRIPVLTVDEERELAERLHYEGDVEASRVPPEWHAWLHYTVDTPPSEGMPERNSWEKPHQVNMTGTSHAHKPKGSLLDDVPEAAEGVGYQAWKPE